MLGSNMRFPIFRFSIFLGGCCFILFLSGCASFQVEGEMQEGRRALQSGEPKVALPHFQRVAELDTDYLTLSPLDQGVWTYVGRAYYGMGKLPEARKALERARSRYEQDHVARLYLGLVLAQSGERQRGLREAEAGLRGLGDWLEEIQWDLQDMEGVFWDPNDRLASEIQTILAMINSENFSLSKLVASCELLGRDFEEEIDLASLNLADDQRHGDE